MLRRRSGSVRKKSPVPRLVLRCGPSQQFYSRSQSSHAAIFVFMCLCSRGIADGKVGGSASLVKVIFGGLAPVHRTSFRLDKFITTQLLWRRKERYASSNGSRMLQLDTCFLLLFILSCILVGQANYCHACKMGVVKGVVHIFPTTQPPLLQCFDDHCFTVVFLYL